MKIGKGIGRQMRTDERREIERERGGEREEKEIGVSKREETTGDGPTTWKRFTT